MPPGSEPTGPGKNVARLKAWLVFIDESVFLKVTLDRCGWAPCGQTPVSRQHTSSHRKVSVVGALCLALELNTIEYLRGYLKMNPLASLAKSDAGELAGVAWNHARSLLHCEDLSEKQVETIVMRILLYPQYLI